MTSKIALEEHFLTPDMIDYWLPTVETIPQKVSDRLRAQLLDFDGERLETMDKAGIDLAILSLSGPGVQAEPDTATAIKRARLANDVLAEKIARHPKRYGGFAHLAMQDGKAAAEELERCVTQLGFHGSMIDGQTNGQYLDEPQYDVFWERAAALNAPVYLHPADPEVAYAGLRGHEKLKRATWEWGVETATHALRIVFGGVFERHPNAKLALGHLGETLPYLLWRLDSRITVLYGLSEQMRKLPSEYIRNNIIVTNSGMCSKEPMTCAIDALGEDNVMFSVDYPFESTDIAVEFIESMDMSPARREKICSGNAKRIFGL
jgi:2,3-dihydroxybenzoate decarboxylase